MAGRPADWRDFRRPVRCFLVYIHSSRSRFFSARASSSGCRLGAFLHPGRLARALAKPGVFPQRAHRVNPFAPAAWMAALHRCSSRRMEVPCARLIRSYVFPQCAEASALSGLPATGNPSARRGLLANHFAVERRFLNPPTRLRGLGHRAANAPDAPHPVHSDKKSGNRGSQGQE